MRTAILIAVGAGLVSALLLMTASGGAIVGVMFLSPLPVAIVALGWGWQGGLIAAIAAAGAIALLGTLKLGALHFVLFGLPITISAYFLLLNRVFQDAKNQQHVEWYPVGRVLFAISIAAGVVGAGALLSVASTQQELLEHAQKMVGQLLDGSADLPGRPANALTPEAKERLASYVVYSFTTAAASFWLWVIVFNLWIGGKVARASGQLARPWPNITMIELPRLAGICLAATAALSLIGDYAGLIIAGFAGSLFLTFMLVGLAIIHNVTWNQPMRPLILTGVYAMLVFLNPISSFAVAVLALIEPIWRIRRPERGGLPPIPPARPNNT